MRIETSSPHDISLINSVIERSKRNWDYSEAYLEAAIPMIQINAGWLRNNAGYSIFESNELIGFLGVEHSRDFWTLEHLWILPSHIRRGVGSKALDFIIGKAKKSLVSNIYLLPDPPAEGFYYRKGAQLTGRVVQSRLESGPMFQEMVFRM